MSQTKAQLIDNLVQPITGAAGSASAPTFSFTADPNTGLYSPGADQLALSTNGTGRLFVNSSGQVGVGVQSPLFGPLHVREGTNANVIFATEATEAAIQAFNDAGSSEAPLRLRASEIKLFTSATERLRITSAGLVGIGTSSPQKPLHVATSDGRVRFEATGTDGNGGIELVNDARRYQVQVNGGASDAFQIYDATGSASRLVIDTSGNVGIGTTSPDVNLAIQSSSTNSIVKLKGTSSTNGGQLQVNATNFILRNRDNGSLQFWTNDSEKAQIDSSGRLLVGTSSARSNLSPAGSTAKFQVEGTNNDTNKVAVISSFNSATAAVPAGIYLSRAGSTGVGSTAIVANDNQLGQIYFQGSDGTNFLGAASIRADVDGTPGANDMPGRLVFSTTADGASSPTERLRIDSSGRVGIGTSSPSSIFDVQVGTSAGINFTTSGQNPIIDFLANSVESAVRIQGIEAFGGGRLQFATKTTGGALTNRLIINESGNVGIGTTSPGYPLDVNGSINIADNQLIRSAGQALIARYSGSNAIYVGSGAATDSLLFNAGGNEKARLDTSGRLLVGTSSTDSIGNVDGKIQIQSTGSDSTVAIKRNSANSGAPYISFGKSRGTGVNQHTIVQADDGLGAILFSGADGSDTATVGASIFAYVDGTPGANDMPGRLVFSTTSDGASSPTERMRIDSGGTTIFKGNTTNPIVRVSGISGGDSNYSVDIKHPSTAKIDFVQRWFTSSQQEQIVLSFGSGNLFSLPTYGAVVGGTNRDVYIDNAGLIGYVSSTRNSKDNITAITDTAWINQLNPVSFNRRKLDEDKQYTNELYSELEYGLIAEEVEQVAPELCFYDEVDGKQELRGVHYSKLISPMLKALQQANARIEALEAEVAALKAS